ncbi:uncharacterized protein LOC113229226 [Hyposmocoma kahamanoa]|uniref:uncharacterized protein LOC113229226 n=1 Tax=Hyposmocoma kahamanoa TaxID=1477025 RepID=UPI000E6D6FA6|nr:uncharacterized protein LOC113229226 [Hyposmocoma kahamanoa]
MSLRKIPSDFQTLLHASNKITSYRRAVEELVYNSLDAASTSIAIRLSIEENVIQVIDNGCGVRKIDFNLLGQKHTTSKFVDLTALKSAPNKYGFRGQSLANIIEVSQSVKITSRHEDLDDTWYKFFYKGKEQNIMDSKQRPSKGTTVEIKGFLYNLSIQKKSINALSEINDIKHFLEQLSLLHTNTSLSLRDDTKNEIIFKIHKNRDIYQTLSSIYGIKKTDLQELKVEKNQYKVTAFIGKRDTEQNKKQLIFLNGKIVQNGKIQSIINHNLSKALKLNYEKKRNLKSKICFNSEDTELPKGKIPFYLVSISCPYYDYDISYTPKQSVFEFKNWDQISKLLEKLVNFYGGDVNLREIKQTVMKEAVDQDKGNEVKNEVKKIMDKILGSNSKRPAVSQMQNGIKGKLAKRKIKKKIPKISLSKIIPQKTRSSITHEDINCDNVNDISENGLHVVNVPKNSLVKEKKIAEIVLHDYMPLSPRFSPCSFDNRVWDGWKKMPCKSSYDLVKTILTTQQTIDRVTSNVTRERMSSLIEINELPPLRPSCSSDVHRGSEIPLFPRLTYDSHNSRLIQCNVHETIDNNINKHFISTQSEDDFVIPNHTQNTRERYKTNVQKIIDFKHNKQNDIKKSIFDIQHMWNFQQESVAIDCSTRSNDHLVRSCVQSFAKTNEESVLNERKHSDYHLTYTLPDQNHQPLRHKYNIFDETYTLDALHITPDGYNHQKHAGLPENLDAHRCDQNYTKHSNSDNLQYSRKSINTTDNVNVVFVSESQEYLIQKTSEINIEPLEICEIVHSQDVEIIDHSIRQNNDSLFNDEFYINSSFLDKDAYVSAPRNSSEGIIKGINDASYHLYNRQTIDKVFISCGTKNNINIENTTKPLPMYDFNKKGGDNFTIRNRLRFIPKGMSPIFENCQTKTVCDYNLNKDYFEKTLYDDFANNVQVTSEMLQPGIQNIKDLTTKEIQKADNKLKKDNASLIFNADSLKQAKVLGQVDEKFIAAQIKGKCYQSLEISEYLVLFDQHAVHERIRLENNLADYLIDDKWKSITLDGFILKLPKEDILYLHNYKDKFSQFGLNWTVLNDREVTVSAIPEAILGKNPRQVAVVTKAVKNIISEEINAMKLQKGCVSLYPKTIMDLVFSEACRYAIKFGDKLSKNECVELLNQLSECKTPFQCAHGRPVMAVLLELKRDCRSYTVSYLSSWKRNLLKTRKFVH